jgi:hypothetical protein
MAINSKNSRNKKSTYNSNSDDIDYTKRLDKVLTKKADTSKQVEKQLSRAYPNKLDSALSEKADTTSKTEKYLSKIYSKKSDKYLTEKSKKLEIIRDKIKSSAEKVKTTVKKKKQKDKEVSVVIPTEIVEIKKPSSKSVVVSDDYIDKIKKGEEGFVSPPVMKLSDEEQKELEEYELKSAELNKLKELEEIELESDEDLEDDFEFDDSSFDKPSFRYEQDISKAEESEDLNVFNQTGYLDKNYNNTYFKDKSMQDVPIPPNCERAYSTMAPYFGEMNENNGGNIMYMIEYNDRSKKEEDPSKYLYFKITSKYELTKNQIFDDVKAQLTYRVRRKGGSNHVRDFNDLYKNMNLTKGIFRYMDDTDYTTHNGLLVPISY